MEQKYWFINEIIHKLFGVSDINKLNENSKNVYEKILSRFLEGEPLLDVLCAVEDTIKELKKELTPIQKENGIYDFKINDVELGSEEMGFTPFYEYIDLELTINLEFCVKFVFFEVTEDKDIPMFKVLCIIDRDHGIKKTKIINYYRQYFDKGGILSEKDFNNASNKIKKIFDARNYNNTRTSVIEKVDAIEDSFYKYPYISRMLIAPTLWGLFANLCHSVLVGEYAMEDGFNSLLMQLKDILQPQNSYVSIKHQRNVTNYLIETIRECLVPMITDYIRFNTFVDAQIDKKPSAVLIEGKRDVYYYRQKYDRLIDRNLSERTDVDRLMEIMPYFFHELLEMTKIDQNFYYSEKRFYILLNIWETLNDKERGLIYILTKNPIASIIGGETCNILSRVLRMVNIKNNLLISKTICACQEEVRDLTYVGRGKRYVFDARRCEDTRHERNYVELLTRKVFEDELGDNELMKIFGQLQKKKDLDTNGNETLQILPYEEVLLKLNIETDEKKIIERCREYLRELVPSESGAGGTDIRHYNSKIIEMAKGAFYDTAELRAWIKTHRFDYDEVTGFNQIKKVNFFIESRKYKTNVCYDLEFLIGYTKWCLEFLDRVANKPIGADTNPNGVDRTTEIENGLLLLDSLNMLTRELVNNIEKEEYCVPVASKYRGCYCRMDMESNEIKTIRYFVKDKEKDEFKEFVKGEKLEVADRRQFLFVASTFNPPVNYEKLRKTRVDLETSAKIIRSKIHADYFDRIRNYIKADTEKQLVDNRRQVVQLLGIFAALLALTTVALTSTTSDQSPDFFLVIMIGFTICLGFFVIAINCIVQGNRFLKIEARYRQNLDLKMDEVETLRRNVADAMLINKEQEKSVSDTIKKIEQKTHKLKRELNDMRWRYWIKRPMLWMILCLIILSFSLFFYRGEISSHNNSREIQINVDAKCEKTSSAVLNLEEKQQNENNKYHDEGGRWKNQK